LGIVVRDGKMQRKCDRNWDLGMGRETEWTEMGKETERTEMGRKTETIEWGEER
jgi:hypothetical protein